MAVPIFALLVAHGRYTIRDGAAVPLGAEAFRTLTAGNTLVLAEEGSVLLLAGKPLGWIDLSVELAEQQPALDLSAVEAAVDVSYLSPTGQSYLVDGEDDRFEPAGNLAHAGPGWYRMRVTATGRVKASREELLPDEEEWHTIAIWPARPAAAIVYKRDRLFPRPS